MSQLQTILRFRILTTIKPLSPPTRAISTKSTFSRTISTKPYFYEPGPNSYNLYQRKWNLTREVYEQYRSWYAAAQEQVSMKEDEFEAQAASYESTIFASCRDQTNGASKAHSEGFDTDRGNTREA
ncbi:Nn.00g001050.m01.CDS01 [Neocucurbitaria sp. VM-36]